MRKYRGLKPHDIAILGMLVTEKNWPSQSKISRELCISQSEVSLGFKALEKVGLIQSSAKKVNKISVKEFIIHVIKYLIPIEKEGISRGFLTGPSSVFFKDKVHSDNMYIWPHEEGDSKGIIINSVIAKMPESIISNRSLYLFLSIVDIFRGLGGVRHLKEAEKELERLIHE